VLSAEHANKATGALKNAILEAMSHTGSTRVDLFFAGPAFLALLLGHRINAVATVRRYEWRSRGVYVPTCELPS